MTRGTEPTHSAEAPGPTRHVSTWLSPSPSQTGYRRLFRGCGNCQGLWKKVLDFCTCSYCFQTPITSTSPILRGPWAKALGSLKLSKETQWERRNANTSLLSPWLHLREPLFISETESTLWLLSGANPSLAINFIKFTQPTSRENQLHQSHSARLAPTQWSLGQKGN